MSEYKEFWIQASNMIAHDDKPPTVNPIHVIEYAAFEKLKKQNKIMREVLEFYADSINWDDFGEYDKTSIDANDWDSIDLIGEDQFTDNEMFLGGKRARQALKAVEGVG